MEKSPAVVTAVLCVKNNCTGCGGCLASCPVGALSLTTPNDDGWGKKTLIINQAECMRCGSCIPACRRESLCLVQPSPEPPESRKEEVCNSR